MRDPIDWLGDLPPTLAFGIIMGAALVMTVLLLGSFFLALWLWEHRPGERFVDLNLKEWECTASHVEHVPGMMSGKVYIPAHDVTVCDQWTRR